ncbi:MAG: MBL fold metallo-hydrolase [Patescibacteria group bacterium]|jgi:competence protein ComEC
MKSSTKIIFTVLISTLFFLWTEIAKGPASDAVSLHFFDVGQGDAALISKKDFQILIDGGPDDSIMADLGAAMPLSDRKIEVIVLTHPHADHLIGLNKVFDRFDVGAVYSPGVLHTSDAYLEFLRKVRDKKIELFVPAVFDEIVPFENGQLQFLWPGDKFKEQSAENLNNASEITRFCYFERCAIFLGDAEREEQDEMLAHYDDYPGGESSSLASDILKVSHHGSSNGADEAMYEKVLPKYSIISVGDDNKYGHPHQESLDLAQRKGSTVLRTDREGTVMFRLDKNGTVLYK